MDVLDCKGAAYTFLDNIQETKESKKQMVKSKKQNEEEDEGQVTNKNIKCLCVNFALAHRRRLAHRRSTMNRMCLQLPKRIHLSRTRR